MENNLCRVQEVLDARCHLFHLIEYLELNSVSGFGVSGFGFRVSSLF